MAIPPESGEDTITSAAIIKKNSRAIIKISITTANPTRDIIRPIPVTAKITPIIIRTINTVTGQKTN